MSSRKTLKSVSVEGLKPTITLTPVIEPCGEGCRIHHIKSDSIAYDGRDTFVPLRHVSKQKRRIFELEEENARLRELARGMYGMLATFDAILGNHDACETPRPLIFSEDKSFKDIMRELGIEVS